MYARSTSIQAQTSNIDAGIAYVRDEVMPALQDMDGYVGLSLLVDRESGRCIATSAWETEDALRTSTEQAAPLRDRAAEIFGGDVTVDPWEIGVLHRDHRSNEGACVRATWIKMPPDQVERAIEFYKTSVSAVPRGPRGILQRQPADQPLLRARRVIGDVRQPRRDGAQQGAGKGTAEHADPRTRR